MNSMSGCDIPVLFYFSPQRQYTAVQKNAYTPEITFLALVPTYVCSDSLCTMVGDLSIKTNFDFNFDLYSAFKQNEYTKTWKQRETVI